MTQHITVELTRIPAELFKILKFEGIASSGAEAKLMVENGQVQVNGEPESRKRRKILPGDTIVIDDIILNITSSQEL